MWSATAKKCIQCPVSWNIVGDHCYNIFTSAVNGTTALSACQNVSSTLVPISNLDDFYLVQSFALRLGGSASVWVQYMT